MNAKQLESYWRISLKGRNRELVQYIKAENFDEAIKKAQNTFHARLEKLDGDRVTKEGQRACRLTKINKPLRFVFCGGWVTVKPNNQNVFEMLDEAKTNSYYTKGREITEIFATYGSSIK